MDALLPTGSIRTVSAWPSSGSPSTPGERGGAAPLDRSTRSPLRPIPFWRAAPMGQGDLKSQVVSTMRTLEMQQVLLGVADPCLPRRPDPVPSPGCASRFLDGVAADVCDLESLLLLTGVYSRPGTTE